MSALRLAGAPISWGVCEVPGWGHVLPVEQVLSEMASLGLRATELGPPGFLPEQVEPLRARLAAHGLTLVGAFLALVLHDASVREATLSEAERACALLAGAGGQVLVVAAATGLDDYDTRPVLDDDAWVRLVDTLDDVSKIATSHGLVTAVHPHVGTHIETAAEVDRFLASSSLPLCLDTGHLLIGGTDPLALAGNHGGRVAHVHLKDVDAAVAAQVRSGEISYQRAVAAGLYRPLGQGDVPVREIIQTLTAAGYERWWVLEQDTALPVGQDGPPASGIDHDDSQRQPRRDTAASIAYFTAALPSGTVEKEIP
ncbi:MAG: TIM barrel protein [Geodermatophilaceae bacterium]|nr:TIM barrel protein [Geodermatophilaceae bacterium]